MSAKYEYYDENLAKQVLCIMADSPTFEDFANSLRNGWFEYDATKDAPIFRKFDVNEWSEEQLKDVKRMHKILRKKRQKKYH